MEQATVAKKKPAYSVFSNVKFVLTNLWKSNKTSTIVTFLRAPLMVLAPFLGIYLSKEVVGAVTQGKSPGDVLYTIFSISATLLVLLIVDKHLHYRHYGFMSVSDYHYQMLIVEKCVNSDYENMESPAGQTRISKAKENTGYEAGASFLIVRAITSFAANCIGILSYAAILIRLSPLILLTVTATTLSGLFVLKITATWRYRNKDKWKTYDRKLEYLRQNSGDFTRAKDLRLYSMTDWFRRVLQSTLSDRMKWHKKEQLLGFKADGLQAVMSLVREGVSYGFLVYLVYAKNLSVADFVLYFGVIGGFSGWLNGIVGDLNDLNHFHLNVSEIREFLEYPDRSNHGAGIPLPDRTFRVDFRNVSYRHPGNSEDTIKDLSFAIEKGEKVAIVGLNGAGKTTLVKLMCGLYTPAKGEILVDGRPVNAYNREEYFSLFAAVFQDISLMPFSIARNVSATTEEGTDRQRVRGALALAGLISKVDALPGGIDTNLVKSVYPDAVDLSGGETQKLALARALYKDGKALILDEPTAALDPIAESNIYAEYNRMAAGRTSVFISHRLASTRFCDRIFFLENGKIVECGSHDELMARRGRYYEMFEVQSHYYREGAIEHDEP